MNPISGRTYFVLIFVNMEKTRIVFYKKPSIIFVQRLQIVHRSMGYAKTVAFAKFRYRLEKRTERIQRSR